MENITNNQENINENEKRTNFEEKNEEKDINLEKEGFFAASLDEINIHLKEENDILENEAKDKEIGLTETLSELRKIGEQSIKRLSEQTVKMFKSNIIAKQLRSFYVRARANQLDNRLKKINLNDDIEDYKQFLKLLRSDFYEKNNCQESAINLLNTISEKKPELLTDALNTWPKIVKTRDHKNIGQYNEIGNWEKSISLQIKNIKKENENIGLDDIEDEFTALSYIEEIKKENRPKKEIILNYLDSIIEKYPDLEFLPTKAYDALFSKLSSSPEEIMSDKKRQGFLFKIWLNKIFSAEDIDKNLKYSPLFTEHIRDMQGDEKNNFSKSLLDKISSNSYYFQNQNIYWLINLAQINQADLKSIQKKDKSLSKLAEINFKNNILNKDYSAEEEFNSLIEIADQTERSLSLNFFNYLITNYPNRNINTEQVGQILDKVLNDSSKTYRPEALAPIVELMKRNNWPTELKQRIFNQSHFYAEELNKISTQQEDEYLDWVKDEPLLNKYLVKEFYKLGKDDDIRHYFFETLDGKHQVDDFDDLILGYANRYGCNPETVVNIFLKRKVDLKYLELFLSKADSYFLTYAEEQLKENSINQEEYLLLLNKIIEYSRADVSILAFNKLKNDNYFKDENEEIEAINSLSKNISEKPINNKNYIEDISTKAFDPNFLSSLNEKIEKIYLKNIFENSLEKNNTENTSILLANNLEHLSKLYEGEDYKNYLKNFFDKTLITQNESVYKHIDSFFSKPEIFKDLDITNLEEIEDKIFSLNIKKNCHLLLHKTEVMNEKQKEKFINYFKENYSIRNGGGNNESLISIVNYINQVGNFYTNKEVCNLVYKSILKDPDTPSIIVNRLLNKNILLDNQELIEELFKNLDKWPSINGLELLLMMAQADNPGKSNLSVEDVKKLSTTTIENNGLSPAFWKNYLKSDKEQPAFFLNQELFDLGIEKMNLKDLSIEETIDFTRTLDDNGVFDFNEKHKKSIIENTLNNKNKVSTIELFHAYQPDLTEECIKDKIINYLNASLASNVRFSDELNERLLSVIISNGLSSSMLENACSHFTKHYDTQIIEKIKQEVKKQDSIENEKILLKYDLLTVAESKSLYEKSIASTENIREKIILSIDIIGSMLSKSENIFNLKDFFDDPKAENIQDLKEISDFISKYNKENKGRTIVTMMFAKHFLPDRNIKEVTEKVSTELRKYQKVLDQYSYKNTPEGIKSSIGMEYEITSSTAEGYNKLTGQNLKQDIAKISEIARIGSGKDAVHEIATKPTDNPYLMLLEMKLLHDIDYIDLNFDRSEDYQKGSRGFHLTIGGENGLKVNSSTQFLQNIILASSWGGVQAGETGKKVNGGRGISLRQRSELSQENIPFFDKNTPSVELRSLSIDKEETLQRSVTTAFHGAIAIQALEKCDQNSSLQIANLINSDNKNLERIENELHLKNDNEKIVAIAKSWVRLIKKVNTVVNWHNNDFLEAEMFGYLDDKDVWVDAKDFGGQYNKKRFESIIANLDQTLSLEEYTNTTNITNEELFQEFSVSLSDKLTKINNLYLKPGTSAVNKDGEKSKVFQGDNANVISMLETTKLNNQELESYSSELLKSSALEMSGEKRQGYYNLQGASEKMITHGIQKALIEFNQEMEKLLN